METKDIRARLDRAGVLRSDVLALCDEIDRLRAGKQKPEGKTVNVRIAVAVDEFKNWSAAGWNGAKDDEMKDGLFDAMEGVAVLHYVTATLPVPEATEVQGEVHTATTDENATSGGRG